MGKIKARQRLTAFVAHCLAMIESPAWQVLSLSARRVLDRIEMEHMLHGGQENGKLPVTYDNFEDYGIHRHSIGPAIRELVALGFIQITRQGRAGNADQRKSTWFFLTHVCSGNRREGWIDPTNEWRRFKTIEDAEAAAAEARTATVRRKLKNRKPVVDSATGVSAVSATGRSKSPVADSTTTGFGKNHHYYLESRGGWTGGERGGNGDRDRLKLKRPLERHPSHSRWKSSEIKQDHATETGNRKLRERLE